MLLKEMVKNLQEPLPAGATDRREVGGGQVADYMAGGQVALALNLCVGPLNWDFSCSKPEVIVPPTKLAGSGYHALAMAMGTVTIRFTDEAGLDHECSRTDVGFGHAHKARTTLDALKLAMKAAATDSFKRACRYLGPRTGLSLQFDKDERMSVEAESWSIVSDKPHPSMADRDSADTDDEPVALLPDELPPDVPAELPTQTELVGPPGGDNTIEAPVQQPGEVCSLTHFASLLSFVRPALLAQIAIMPEASVLGKPAAMELNEALTKKFGRQLAQAMWFACNREKLKPVERWHVVSLGACVADLDSGKTTPEDLIQFAEPRPDAKPAATADPALHMKALECLQRILGPGRDELALRLATMPDDAVLSAAEASGLATVLTQRVAGSRFQAAIELWLEVGCDVTKGPPTVAQAHEFLKRVPRPAGASG